MTSVKGPGVPTAVPAHLPCGPCDGGARGPGVPVQGGRQEPWGAPHTVMGGALLHQEQDFGDSTKGLSTSDISPVRSRQGNTRRQEADSPPLHRVGAGG